MDVWIDIIVKAFWCGFASLGFGVLFNTPSRTLFVIWLGGFVAGCVKLIVLQTLPFAGVILASFLAAVVVGIVSIPVAHLRHVPPMIFTIPSVIPLVPGVFAYRTMLGLMKLTENINVGYRQAIEETIYNGVITLFIIMALSLGVTIPMQIMTKDSVKKIRWKK